MITWGLVGHRLRMDPGQVKPRECKIGICCSSANHAAIKSKSKDWLSQSQRQENDLFK